MPARSVRRGFRKLWWADLGVWLILATRSASEPDAKLDQFLDEVQTLLGEISGAWREMGQNMRQGNNQRG